MPSTKDAFESSLLHELQSVTDECRMCEILRQLPPKEKDALLVVIKKMKEKNATKQGRAKKTYTYRWLAETLTKHGFSVDRRDVRNYMTGKCDC